MDAANPVPDLGFSHAECWSMPSSTSAFQQADMHLVSLKLVRDSSAGPSSTAVFTIFSRHPFASPKSRVVDSRF